MGRPDYDAGDLVVCVDDTPNPKFGVSKLRRGAVYVVEKVEPPNRVDPRWGCRIAGVASLSREGFAADRFRKIDPKPPEFWTGEVEVENREPAHAG